MALILLTLQLDLYIKFQCKLQIFNLVKVQLGIFYEGIIH